MPNPFQYPVFTARHPTTNQPLSGGKVNFYEAGTTDAKDTYSDSTLLTANTNPVILDANGEATIYLSGSYKVVLTESDDTQIWSLDNVTSIEETSEWTTLGAATFISTTSFSVTGDQTAELHPGRRVRLTDSSTLYGTISTSVYGTLTTVTVRLDSGSITSSLISCSYGISSSDNPSIGYQQSYTNAVFTEDQYATLGSNVSGAISFTHVAGSEETQSAAITTEGGKLYLLELVLTTTTSGFIKILFDDADKIYGDQSNGLWFSTETVLTDGTENNRILDSVTYSYVISTFAGGNTSFSTLKLTTDTVWAGTVTSVSLKEITTKPMSFKALPNDAPEDDLDYGLKTANKNKNDIAFGDVHSLCVQQTDAGLVGAHNVAVGARALSFTQFGDQNTGVGTYALQSVEGSNNTGVGYSALKLCNKGQENTAVGYKVGTFVTTGYKNTFMGFWAGSGVRTGRENVDIGWRPNTEPADRSRGTSVGSQAFALSDGTAVGYSSSATGERSLSGGGESTASGIRTVAMGDLAESVGDYTTGLGFRAGNTNTGTYNTFLGWQSGFAATAYTYTVCLGAGSVATKSYQVVLGGSNIVETLLRGAVIKGISTLANSATPSVAGSDIFLTGGTTTITDFTNGVTGQTITILSEHAITITDGTNMFLNGSVNFVMASTDSLTLIQKADGNWYEISRSVN